MSAEATPVLSGAVASFEVFMTRWEKLCENYPMLRFWVNSGLPWANKYYWQMDETDAYIVTMSRFFKTLL